MECPLFALLTIPAALAGDTDGAGPLAVGSVGIGARLSGELLSDRNLALAYGSSSLSGEIHATVALPYYLELGTAVGYRRLSGNLVDEAGLATDTTSWLWYAPIQLTIGARIPLRSISVFVATGPGVVVWEEEQPPELALGVGSAGAKPAWVFEGGASVPIGMQRSLHNPDKGPVGLDVNILLGYRHSFRSHSTCIVESPCGLSFSALKAAAGLTLRL
ncbi:MAG TPA: hypothetical protein PKY30_00245 [Myxococcota bacterium]|nr:hypothetical protein [Myxococcota bacterium]